MAEDSCLEGKCGQFQLHSRKHRAERREESDTPGWEATLKPSGLPMVTAPRWVLWRAYLTQTWSCHTATDTGAALPVSGLKANELARLEGLSLQGLHGNTGLPGFCCPQATWLVPPGKQECRGAEGSRVPLHQSTRHSKVSVRIVYFSV